MCDIGDQVIKGTGLFLFSLVITQLWGKLAAMLEQQYGKTHVAKNRGLLPCEWVILQKGHPSPVNSCSPG